MGAAQAPLADLGLAMRPEPTRAQLQEAYRLAGIGSVSLDQALADPVLSRLLRIGASAMLDRSPQSRAARRKDLPAWAKQLQQLAGHVDYRRIAAGDND